MRIFKLDDRFQVVCESKSTRSGAKHEAVLMSNGYQVEKTKICYLNRTWEYFEYESVLVKLINLQFSGVEREKYLAVIKTLG